METKFRPLHKHVILAEPDINTRMGDGQIEKSPEAIEKEKKEWAQDGKPFEILAIGPDVPEGIIEVGQKVSTFAVNPMIINGIKYLRTDFNAIIGVHED